MADDFFYLVFQLLIPRRAVRGRGGEEGGSAVSAILGRQEPSICQVPGYAQSQNFKPCSVLLEAGSEHRFEHCPVLCHICGLNNA